MSLCSRAHGNAAVGAFFPFHDFPFSTVTVVQSPRSPAKVHNIKQALVSQRLSCGRSVDLCHPPQCPGCDGHPRSRPREPAGRSATISGTVPRKYLVSIRGTRAQVVASSWSPYSKERHTMSEDLETTDSAGGCTGISMGSPVPCTPAV